MATTPSNEEPGFERDESNVPGEGASVSEDTLEDAPAPDGDENDMEKAQRDAAEERAEEGGYQ
ncbi:hypothetical protein [Sphingomonas sp. RS2018]